jgi:hypothetical protein
MELPCSGVLDAPFLILAVNRGAVNCYTVFDHLGRRVLGPSSSHPDARLVAQRIADAWRVPVRVSEEGQEEALLHPSGSPRTTPSRRK